MRYTGTRSSGLQRLFNAAYHVPTDLLLIAAFVIVVDAVQFIAPSNGGVQFVVGVPLLFFLPGYVIIAVLFPAEGNSEETVTVGRSWRPRPATGLTFAHRLALSFGTSVMVLPLLAIGMDLVGMIITHSTVIGVLSGHVLLGALLGTIRRLRLAPEDRMRLPVGRWTLDFWEFLSGGERRLDTWLNLLLVASVLIGMSGLAFAIGTPSPGGDYTNFLLLTRGGDGEMIASGYPTEFVRGEGRELVVGIENHRADRTRYTVVVEVQRVRGAGTDLVILERQELHRFNQALNPGSTWYKPHTVASPLVGDDLRVAYYLYTGESTVPQPAPINAAADHLHLWINASSPS